MAVFQGAGVAIVTPFKANGEVNYDKFAELLEFQIGNGTDAIIVCGTTGESSTLTHEEHLEVIRFCVEKVAGRIPVVAGTGSNCTETAVYLSTEAEKYGADAVLLVTPYYNKATQKGLYRHYKTVADAIRIPAIIYNVPSRTGCNVLPETVVKLCTEVENIVGVKEASGSISQVVKLMALADGKVDLYSGNDDQIVLWEEKALFPFYPTWLRGRRTISAQNFLPAMWKGAAGFSARRLNFVKHCSAK